MSSSYSQSWPAKEATGPRLRKTVPCSQGIWKIWEPGEMSFFLIHDLNRNSFRLEEAGSNTSTQIELNKKREVCLCYLAFFLHNIDTQINSQAELAKLKVDLDEANISHEGTLAALRQKHNNSMAELGNQIDAINKNKAQSEKDKAAMASR